MQKPEVRKLSLNGPQGLLQATLAIPVEISDSVAVVCHPHPLYGGSMDNKVVHYTARALLDVGVPVLRFNFRGVGESAGSFDEAVGEVEDCMAAVDWLLQNFPGHQLILAGFSFGSYIALRAAQNLKLGQLILIAPPVDRYEFSKLQNPTCPWMVIQGDEDEVVAREDVACWIETTDPEPDFLVMEQADHFFHRRLMDLRGLLKNGVRPNLPEKASS